MDENARPRPHITSVVQDYLQKEGIVRVDWPAHSPRAYIVCVAGLHFSSSGIHKKHAGALVHVGGWKNGLPSPLEQGAWEVVAKRLDSNCSHIRYSFWQISKKNYITEQKLELGSLGIQLMQKRHFKILFKSLWKINISFAFKMISITVNLINPEHIIIKYLSVKQRLTCIWLNAY